MAFSYNMLDLTNSLLHYFNVNKLKSAIQEAIANNLHLPDVSNVQIEGKLMIFGTIAPITLVFGDDKNSETRSQSSRTPSKRKAYRPVKFTGQTTQCSDELLNTNQISRSESTSPTSMIDCALDLTKGTSVSSSLQETPVKQSSIHANEVMRLFQRNLIPSPSLTLFQSTTTLPTMSSAIRFEHHSDTAFPKKRRRVGETSARKADEFRQFRCNQCDDTFNSLQKLESHTQETHGGFRCHLCQGTFTQRSNLQRHALKHVNFKPFECTLCGKAYYRKDHLMRHMQKAHHSHPAEENIRVKLKSSESLDYLRQLNEDRFKTNTAMQDEKTSNEHFKMENVRGSGSGEFKAMETCINTTESPDKTSSDLLSDEFNHPNADVFTLPIPLHQNC